MAERSDRPEVEEALGRVLAIAREAGNRHDFALIGPVSDWLRSKAGAFGLDLDGFQHVVDTSAVRHIRKNHSDPQKEKARGQLPISDVDLLLIPQIVADPDNVMFGTTNRLGHEQIVYLKTLGDGSTLYLEEARIGKKQVAAQSMRKYPPTMSVAAIAATLDPNVRSDREAKVKIIDGPLIDKIVAPDRSNDAT